jgi:hypothetical protein
MSAARGLRDVLRAASDVTDLTGTFLERASIFAEDVTPETFVMESHGPCVLIGPATGTQRNDTTGAYGSNTTYRARIYATSENAADELASAVVLALAPSTPVVPGNAARGIIVDDPVNAPTDSLSVTGRSITIRLITERV